MHAHDPKRAFVGDTSAGPCYGTRTHRHRNALSLPAHRHIVVEPVVSRVTREARLASRPGQVIDASILQAVEEKNQPADLIQDKRLKRCS